MTTEVTLRLDIRRGLAYLHGPYRFMRERMSLPLNDLFQFGPYTIFRLGNGDGAEEAHCRLFEAEYQIFSQPTLCGIKPCAELMRLTSWVFKHRRQSANAN
jgi:hypothetical protein